MPSTLTPCVQPAGASIVREALVSVAADVAWDAIADFARVHVRAAPGFVTALELKGAVRTVTFSDGAVADEMLISRDDRARRLVYAIPAGRFTSYSAAFQVLEARSGTCRIVWTIDLAPAAFADYVAGRMDLAVPILKQTLEACMD
jgi:hypothetical protein